MSRSQRHKIEEQGYSSRGEIYEQGAINDQVLKSIGGAVETARPVLSSISPTTAVKGGADLTLTATGTGFDANTKIIFNGGVETTTYVSPTSLTTIVKPSLVTTAGSYPVQVRKGAYLVSAATKTFTFTSTELQEEGGEVSRLTDERDLGPFDLKRIDIDDDDGGAWYVFDRSVDVRKGDTVRVEATGSTDTNGEFEVTDIYKRKAGETAVYWSEAELEDTVTGKGRITIL